MNTEIIPSKKFLEAYNMLPLGVEKEFKKELIDGTKWTRNTVVNKRLGHSKLTGLESGFIRILFEKYGIDVDTSTYLNNSPQPKIA